MQTQFDRKPKRISAWQVPIIQRDDEWDWEKIPHPGWIQDALQKRLIQVEQFPSITHWIVRVQLPGKKVKYAFDGGWVTCDDEGVLDALSSDEIDRDWDKVPE